jgi:hypothetical protein
MDGMTLFLACSMLLTASAVVDFASVTVMVLAPIAIVQKQKLNELGSLRTQQNQLREVRGKMSSITQFYDFGMGPLQTYHLIRFLYIQMCMILSTECQYPIQ